MPRLLLPVIALAVAGSAPVAWADAVVARIGGQAITAEELRLFIAHDRAAVAQRLFAGATVVAPERWRGAPADALRRQAVQDAAAAKILQLVCVERGVLRSADFSACQADWTAENARRAQALAQGEPIYGPRHLPFDAYYQERNAHLRTALATALRNAHAPQSVDALLADRLASTPLTVDPKSLAQVEATAPSLPLPSAAERRN